MFYKSKVLIIFFEDSLNMIAILPLLCSSTACSLFPCHLLELLTEGTALVKAGADPAPQPLPVSLYTAEVCRAVPAVGELHRSLLQPVTGSSAFTSSFTHFAGQNICYLRFTTEVPQQRVPKIPNYNQA